MLMHCTRIRRRGDLGAISLPEERPPLVVPPTGSIAINGARARCRASGRRDYHRRLPTLMTRASLSPLAAMLYRPCSSKCLHIMTPAPSASRPIFKPPHEPAILCAGWRACLRNLDFARWRIGRGVNKQIYGHLSAYFSSELGAF